MHVFLVSAAALKRAFNGRWMVCNGRWMVFVDMRMRESSLISKIWRTT